MIHFSTQPYIGQVGIIRQFDVTTQEYKGPGYTVTVLNIETFASERYNPVTKAQETYTRCRVTLDYEGRTAIREAFYPGLNDGGGGKSKDEY